ncbi:MAG: polyphenol oxidase family protein [Weeksellaceae bacterium]
MITKQSSYFSSSLFPSDTIVSGFGTKALGDARDLETIQNLLSSVHKSEMTIVIPKQTHSTNVAVYVKDTNEKSSVIIPDCDAVVTREKQVLLTCITADCVPMIFVDQQAGVIGLSHQGWKGTLGRLPAKVIQTMCGQGARVENIQVTYGPAINDCCYEIFGERLELFKQEFGDEIFRIAEGKHFLNLYRANYQSLLKAGILPQNIDLRIFCTACDEKRFYSYTTTNPLDGENLTFIGINNV